MVGEVGGERVAVMHISAVLDISYCGLSCITPWQQFGVRIA